MKTGFITTILLLGVMLPLSAFGQGISPAHNFNEPLWFFGIFFGVILSTIVISFVQYLLSKDKAFLYYTLFLIFNMLYFLNFYGNNGGSQDFFSQLPPNIRMGFLMGGYFIYNFFAIEFLKLTKTNFALATKLKNLAWAILIIIVLYFIVFQEGWDNQLFENNTNMLPHHLALVSMMIIGIIGLVLVFRVRTRLSNILVIGAVLYFIGSVSGFVFASFQHNASSVWKNYPLLPTQIGFLFEMLFFSLGLAYRAYVFQKEKRITNKKYIQQLKENQQLELERKDALKYKEINEAKSQVYTNITHEFRTPLTVILGLAEQLEKNPKYKLLAHLETIKRNGHQLLDLVNQLLQLNKLEEGAIQPQYIQGDIIAFLKYLTESYHSFALSKNRTLSFFTSIENELLMDYDPKKLRRIIGNLIFNAIKFTPEYGRIQVVVQQDIHNNELLIKVKDTGQGIPEEALPHIFNRFYQVENLNSHSVEGTGIGLALVKELTELMEGKIHVNSIVGKGSTFELLFPIKNQAPIQAPNFENDFPIVSTQALEESEIPASTIPDELPILLIIEDNEDIIAYLKSCLIAQYHFITAFNGKDGLEKAIEHIPDVIISDVMMPEMDGFEVCEKLKNDERTNHIPIILLTAKSTVKDRLKGLSKGADAYLEKPFNHDELFIRLEKLMTVRKVILEKNNLKTNEKPQGEFLQKFYQIVIENIENEDFDVVKLCKALDMSRSQIHRKVKALTNCSTTQYIRQIKMREAKRMLETTTLNISEIAYKIGYKNPNNFSSHFKAHFGISPSDTYK